MRSVRPDIKDKKQESGGDLPVSPYRRGYQGGCRALGMGTVPLSLRMSRVKVCVVVERSRPSTSVVRANSTPLSVGELGASLGSPRL